MIFLVQVIAWAGSGSAGTTPYCSIGKSKEFWRLWWFLSCIFSWHGMLVYSKIITAQKGPHCNYKTFSDYYPLNFKIKYSRPLHQQYRCVKSWRRQLCLKKFFSLYWVTFSFVVNLRVAENPQAFRGYTGQLPSFQGQLSCLTLVLQILRLGRMTRINS